MSLKTLTLSNWCNHASFGIDFHPSATVLVGDNFSGKSAALRALAWLCLGAWPAKADTHITWGCSYSQVTLITDQHSIERVKGTIDERPVNVYKLDDQVFRFDATLRRGVPEAASAALQLGPDNFQGQHDAAYWFSLTAGDVARSLNRIINLDAIDTSLATIAAEVRQAKAEEKIAQRRLESCQNLTKSTAWVEAAQADWCTVEQVEEQIALQSVRIASIERSISEASRLALIRDRASGLIADAKKVLASVTRLHQTEKAVKSLELTVQAIQECARMRQDATSQLKAQESLYGRYRAAACPLCGK